MKIFQFIIFFSIALSIYFSVNFYIYTRGLQCFPLHTNIRLFYKIIFLILSSSFIIGRILEKIWLSKLSSLFVWVGSFWLGAMVYFFLAVILIDIIRLINFGFPFFSKLNSDYEQLKQITLTVISGIVLCVVLLGYLNALKPRIQKLELTIPKKSSLQELNIVAASDFHLGTIVCRDRFFKIVEKINNLNPDVVLLMGDIVDEDIAPVIKQNLGQALKRFNSKYGIYAVTGNHEYIGGVKAATQYLQNNNITVLSDTAIHIEKSIYIIGREDRSINQFIGKKRKTLSEVMNTVNKNYPIILMDHQPIALHEAMNNGIDLQLSGHTHHGQLFPFNYITEAIFEKSWGYLKKENTHYYISSGVGTWGPPIRTGNHPEIVNIRLTFQK
jgi:uncharacterized protein